MITAREIAVGTQKYLISIGRISAIEATLEYARVDLMSLKPHSFCDTGDLTVYEIKISRSDFLNEIKQQKYLRAMKSCNRFYYLCPPYLILPTELPQNAGLCFYDNGEIKVIKRAKRINTIITNYTLIRLANKLSEELEMLKRENKELTTPVDKEARK
jgi:hypothetical protein